VYRVGPKPDLVVEINIDGRFLLDCCEVGSPDDLNRIDFDDKVSIITSEINIFSLIFSV
jgi:hypothetical protein